MPPGVLRHVGCGAGGHPARGTTPRRRPRPSRRGKHRRCAERGGPEAGRRAPARREATTMQQGMLDVEQLEDLAAAGAVDTVLCMFTDLQGRFMGKRVVPHFFLEEILGAEGLHACLYLLAIDMEMEPLPGYEYASWETGYGDFRMVPDMSTLRWCPWLEKTVMVICDIADEETGEPVEVAPRQILKRQIERAAATRLHDQDRVGAGVLSVPRRLRRDGRPRLPRPAAQLHVHHGLPHAADDQGRVGHPADPQLHARRGDPDRVLEGRVRQGPARDQHHVLRRARHLRLPRALQARREGDLRGQRRRRHVHGEMDDGRGRLVVSHALQRVERRRHRVADVARTMRSTTSPRRSATIWADSWPAPARCRGCSRRS